MKITGWTWCGNPQYEEINGTWAVGEHPVDRDVIRPLIVDELRKRGYKFCGFYHQGGDYGTPIIDGKYTVLYSYRSWGGIMADAYEIQDEDGTAYCAWAWMPPDGEESIFPNPTDYERGLLP